MNKDQQRQNLGLVVARALRDQSFKAELVANPRVTLEKAGVFPPSGMEILIVENTSSRIYLTLPALPLPSAPTFEDMEVLETRKGSIGNATPKDKGCCGGGSSVAATWLEGEDETAMEGTAPVLAEVVMSK